MFKTIKPDENESLQLKFGKDVSKRDLLYRVTLSKTVMFIIFDLFDIANIIEFQYCVDT